MPITKRDKSDLEKAIDDFVGNYKIKMMVPLDDDPATLHEVFALPTRNEEALIKAAIIELLVDDKFDIEYRKTLDSYFYEPIATAIKPNTRSGIKVVPHKGKALESNTVLYAKKES